MISLSSSAWEVQKQKWLKVMTNEFMSSEESEVEDGSDITIVYPLPGRSSYCNNMFKK